MRVPTIPGIAHGFQRRCCRDKDHRTRSQAGPNNGHVPTVIDHTFLLSGGLMLFIDHDQAESRKRQKESRPSPDQHANLAFGDLAPVTAAARSHQNAIPLLGAPKRI